MATNNIGFGVSIIDQTRQGLRNVQSSVISSFKKLEEYTTIQPKIDSRTFDANLSALKNKLNSIGTVVDKFNKKGEVVDRIFSGKYDGQSLSTGAKKKVNWNLQNAFLDENTLRAATSAIKKSLAEGKFSAKDTELARKFVSDAEPVLKLWKAINKEVEAYIQAPAKAANKRKEGIGSAFDKKRLQDATKEMKEREKAQDRLLDLEKKYAVEQQKLGTYNTNLYTDVRKKLTTEQQIVKILDEQARLYTLVGEKSKAANAKGRATRMLNQAEETSTRLINWTGNDKGLIASYDPSNIKKQLNAISRDLTNNIGRESILQLKVEVTGWEQSVSRLRKAISETEKSFKLGGQKFKITGIDSALAALSKIDKMAAKGVKGAAAWQQKLNEYLASHVDVANKYQTYQNKLLESQKRESKQTDENNRRYMKQANLFGRLASLASRYFSIYSVIHFGRQVAETTGYFQQQQVALEGILKSATKAREVLEDIKGFALQSPFQTKELVSFTKQLSAFGIPADDLFPTVTKLADVSAGLGVDMSRIILAYGQVRSASVLRGQELRQFTEAGIPMVDALAKKFTALNGELVTTADVFELISKRQVPFEMVASVLSDMASEGGRFYKMQENITDTLYGQIQKLKDMWTLGMESIGKSSASFLNGVVKLLQSALKYALELAIGIGAAFSVGSITKFLLRFKEYIRHMRVAIKTTRAMSSIWGGIAGILSGVVVGAIVKVVRKSTELKRELEDVTKTFTKESDKLLEGFDSLTRKIQVSKIGTKEFSDAVGTLANNYGEFIGSDILKALQQQGDGVEEATKKFLELADSVRYAIQSYQDYLYTLEKDNTIRKAFIKDKSDNRFKSWMQSNNLLELESVQSDFEKRYGREATDKELKNKWNELYIQALTKFANGSVFTESEYTNIFKEVISNAFPSITQEELVKIVGLGWQAMSRNTSGYGRNNIYSILLDSQKDIEATDYYGITKYFDAIDPLKTIYNNNDSIDFRNNTEAAYIEALYKTLMDKFASDPALSELYSLMTGSFLVDSEGRTIATNFDNNTIASILKLLDAFRNTFTDNPEMQKWLSTVRDVFVKNVEKKTDRAAIVSDLMENNNAYRYSSTESVRAIWSQFIPSDSTYKDLRENIKKEYDSRISERDSYVTKGGKDSAYIKRLNEEIEALSVLASASYYNIDLSSKSSSGSKDKYNRIRITNFFDDLLSLVTKAEDEMKKIVGVTGYTNQLNKFVNSLSQDNFLKAFFEEGGNPFEKIFAKMEEYGVTEFLPDFDKNSLKNIFKDAGWEPGKDISIPDFKSIYENVIKTVGDQVLAGLRTRRDQYEEGSSEYNSLESAIKSLQDQQTNSIKTMETRWGVDEIGNKIESAIKELTNINGNLDKIRSRRDMYDRISKAGNYIDARGALGWRTLSMSNAVSGGILSMLRGPGAGVASTNAGGRLMNMLIGGELNINNLSALLSISKELEEQAASLDPNTSGQFVESTKHIVDAINKLVDDIMVEYEELMQLRTEDMVASDTITNLGESYKIALQNISNGIVNGTITLEEAIEMRRKAVQDNYNSLLNAVGGTELPKWITRLYADGKSPFGVSDKGMKMASTFGSSSINDMVIRALSQKYQAGEYGKVGSEDAIDKFTKEVLDTIAALERMNSIVEKVSSAVNNTVDALESSMGAIRSLGSRLKASNGMQGGIDESYYATQAGFSATSQVLSTIGNFAGGVSGAWGSFMSGDIFGAITGVISTISNLILNIIDINDSLIQNKQDAIIRSNEKLVKAMEDLENALSTSAGNERYDIYKTQRENLMQQKLQYEQLYALELQKKEGDPEKAKEYAEQVKSIDNELSQMIKDFKAEILGTADDLANTLTDALVGAFREGTNAARAWRDAVKSYIGDILKQELMTKVISPFIDDVMDDFFGTEQLGKDEVLDLFSNKDKVNSFVSALNDAGVDLIDIFNQLPEDLKNYISFNGSTSALAGGISGITEDTARTLEGLANSMLMQQVLANQHLSALSGSAFAQVQISWFNDMLMQTRAIKVATEGLNSAVADMRNGIRPMSVTVV